MYMHCCGLYLGGYIWWRFIDTMGDVEVGMGFLLCWGLGFSMCLRLLLCIQ